MCLWVFVCVCVCVCVCRASVKKYRADNNVCVFFFKVMLCDKINGVSMKVIHVTLNCMWYVLWPVSVHGIG